MSQTSDMQKHVRRKKTKSRFTEIIFLCALCLRGEFGFCIRQVFDAITLYLLGWHSKSIQGIRYNRLMPTPFSHMEVAQRLLDETTIPAAMRAFLRANLPAYVLGSIAADARVGSGAKRHVTHFYDYTETIPEPPWRVMVRANPRLMHPHTDAHRAFVAAYAAHLSVDEVWSLRMVRPHFATREWAKRRQRFFMLHIILTHMDERDRQRIMPWYADALCEANPQNWLDFISDDDLRKWQNLIFEQVTPGGESQTLTIFGQRTGVPPEEFRAILDSDSTMQRQLWQHITPGYLAQVEAECYQHATTQMIAYLRETG